MAAIRWGLFGTGRMAAQMAEELRSDSLRDAGAELVAVASRSARRAAQFAERFGIVRSLGSYEELANDPGTDAIYIATPPSEHAAHMMLCLERGKAVLCEKPFTIDAAGARRTVEFARARQLFVMEAMWTRFLPAIAALRRLLADDAIGQPLLAVGGGAFIPQHEPSYYLFSPQLGGGALLDAGVYLISLSSMLLGNVQRVHASGELSAHGVDDHDVFILDHDRGARSLLYVSLRARRPPDMELIGSSGRIQISAPVYRPTRLIVSRVPGEEILEFPIQGSGYGYQVVAAMNAMRQGKVETNEMPWQETLSVMEVMDEIRRQIRATHSGQGMRSSTRTV